MQDECVHMTCVFQYPGRELNYTWKDTKHEAYQHHSGYWNPNIFHVGYMRYNCFFYKVKVGICKKINRSNYF